MVHHQEHDHRGAVVTHPRLVAVALAGVLLGAGWLGYARLISRLEAANRATAAALARLEAQPTRQPIVAAARACPPPVPASCSFEDAARRVPVPAGTPVAADPKIVDEIERDALDVIGGAVSAGAWTADDEMELVALTAQLPRAANERVQQELSMAINAGDLVPAE